MSGYSMVYDTIWVPVGDDNICSFSAPGVVAVANGIIVNCGAYPIKKLSSYSDPGVQVPPGTVDAGAAQFAGSYIYQFSDLGTPSWAAQISYIGQAGTTLAFNVWTMIYTY